ncbi:nickel-dependent lactate racemase, partial [Aduncisulcus paluster]
DKTPGERVEAIRRKFILGGHKAAAIGQVQEMYQVILLSDMPKDIVLASGFEYAQSPEKALEMALDKQGDDAQVIVMPSAGSTLPLIQGKNK